MNKVVFYIHNRGDKFMYHWFIYMIGGLRHIFTGLSRNGKNCFWGKNHGHFINVFEKNSENFNSEKLSVPVKIYFDNISDFLDYQYQTIDLISDTFSVIKQNEISDDDIIIFNYGENILNELNHVSPHTYTFLKKIFEGKGVNSGKYKNKSFFVSRKNSHLMDGNRIDNSARRRQIINEDELSIFLQSEYGIETIELENLSVSEKIELFSASDLIISPNSAALFFTIFCGESSKIIEINVPDPHQINEQYRWQCETLKIPYYKFISNKVDSMDNMFVDIDKFKKFIGDNIK